MSTRAARSRGMPRRRARAQPIPARRPLLMLGIGGAVVIIGAATLAVVLSAAPAGLREPAVRPIAMSGVPLPGLPGAGPDPAVGQELPGLRGSGLDGEPIEIGPTDGAMAIVVLAHWCPHCRADVPRLVDWLATNEMPAGVRLVGISTAIDPVRPNYPPSAWFEREGWTVPTLVDDDGNRALGALGLSSFPGYVFVGAQGTVALRLTGELDVATFAGIVAGLAP